MNHEKNYYKILEVSEKATAQEIRQGYLKTKHAYAANGLALYSLMSDDECEKMLELVEEAYSILGDQERRSKYNQARGIDNTLAEESFSTTDTSSTSPSSTHSSSGRGQSSGHVNISKMVAEKRYLLDYQEDPAFEQEIEQQVDFTGQFLKRIREYKNVDIPRMSDMTKVSKTYLINIEEENVDGLPVPVYIRGFVYQYAKCLKLNPTLVATSYINRLREIIRPSTS
ncbi:MAG: DnaJ domain-containing protein [Bdellovibrionales bacterium]|nr:DnaJ domain-containing protein [Bdellovibrionales bacterium]MBT3525465.1 DnaJ domain-containing protein [Bdellovibrionales bacterium]MBT7768102.1 DnaJ domain-containing protein [Bdellovibrionales bacterium]